MAIDTESARFFLSSFRNGASFESCVTLGRQNLVATHREIRRMLHEVDLDPRHYPRLFEGTYPPYAESFWETLGGRRVESLDISNFEGATLVHDLNLPVPESLVATFDAVCDIGTLEHVFNFLGAIKNALDMVKVGGRFYAITPANNLFGHGFYQFSPELYFRLLSPANGFQVERMFAVAYGVRRRWYQVVDPESVGTRVLLMGRQMVQLFVQARRLERVPLLQRYPQQSDYVTMWRDWPRQQGRTDLIRLGILDGLVKRLKHTLLNHAPSVARALEGMVFSSWNRGYSFRNRSCFRPVNPRKLYQPKATEPVRPLRPQP